MVISGLTKQPGETLKQTLDYEQWLRGSTISGTQVTVSPSNTLVPLSATVSVNAAATSLNVFLTGGLDGFDYTVTVRTTVTDSQVREDEIKLAVREVS
jgi:hypothetical protein